MSGAAGRLLFLLFAAHALCDFALQNDSPTGYISVFKNPSYPPARGIWPWVMGAHALIHGGAVALLTHSTVLGLLEFSFHWMIDLLKCEGKLGQGAKGYATDQALHYFCKVAWCAWAMLL